VIDPISSIVGISQLSNWVGTCGIGRKDWMNRSQLRYVLFMFVCFLLLRGTAVEASARLMLTRASVDVYVYTIECDRNSDDPHGYRFYDNGWLIGEAADVTAPSVIWSIAADDYELHNIAVTAYRRTGDGSIVEVCRQQSAFASLDSHSIRSADFRRPGHSHRRT
jgi:hypothetical protein